MPCRVRFVADHVGRIAEAGARKRTRAARSGILCT
jgi:hypothetical protein